MARWKKKKRPSRERRRARAIELERRGNVVGMRVAPGATFTPPDKKDVAQAALATKKEILAALAPHDAFAVMPAAFLLSIDPELQGEDFPMTLEMTALLLLERGRPASEVVDERRLSDDVRAGLLGAKRLVSLSVWADLVAGGKKGGTAEAALEFKHRLYRRAFRKPGTWEQERALGRMLFGEGDVPALLAAAGAPDIETAIAVVSHLLEQSWKAPEAAMRAETSPLTARQRLLPSRPDREAVIAMVERAARRASDGLVYRPDELAAALGRDEAAVRATLGLLATDFGAVGAGLLYLPGDNPLAERPLLRDTAAGEYVVAEPQRLPPALRLNLERVLQEDGGVTWDSYQSHRAEALERRGLELLAAALRPTAGPVSKVYYELDEGRHAELDGVLVLDNVLVLVEAKAGALGGRGTRPALRDVVGAAVSQAERARAAIKDGATLYDSAGNDFDLDLRGVETILSVELTLADTAWASAATWSLRELGIVDPDATGIWPVSLFDLELVCDLIEVPAQLVHYLLVRQRIDAEQIVFFDELDVFMAYWDNELDKLAAPEPGIRLVSSWTARLDEYLLAREEAELDRTAVTAEPPRQRVSRETMTLFRKLDALRDGGFLRESLTILDRAVRPPG